MVKVFVPVTLRLSDHYSFKNVDKTFTLKTSFSCDSANLIYVVICSGCQEEYIGETGLGKSKLRDRVRIYKQHIRQQEYQQLKIEEHLRSWGRDKFTIFPLFLMRSDDKHLRRSYQERFQKRFNTKLNKL